MTTQLPLPYQSPICSRCSYRQRRLCFGSEEAISLFPKEEQTIGCHDSDRQSRAYRELHDGWIPKAAPALQQGLILPRFIPVVPPRSPRGSARFERGLIFGVSFKTVVKQNGALEYTSPVRLRAALRLPPDARLALIANAKDPKIEEFWSQAAKRKVWSRLVGLNFEFATSCTYSVYDRDPYFDQIYNQERNWRTYEVFSELGLPTIPFVFRLRHRNQLELKPWFDDHPEVKIVAMLAQRLKSPAQFQEFVLDMEDLASVAQRDLHFLVVGVAKGRRIHHIASRFNATFVTDQPFQCALHGKQLDSELRPHKANPRVRPRRLAVENVARCIEFCNSLEPGSMRKVG
jgi:hypothetical protein